MHWAKYLGRDAELLCPLQAAAFPAPPFSPAWKLSKATLLGFYGGFITQICLIKSLPIGNQFNLLPLPASPGSRSGTKSTNPAITGLLLLTTTHHPQVTQEHFGNHLTDITERPLSISGHPKAFESLCYKYGQRPNIYCISYYKSQQHKVLAILYTNCELWQIS